MSFDLMYVIAVYFFFILAFGGSKYRVHSAIILFFTTLNVFFELPASNNLHEYISNRAINIAWDGLTGLVMVMFLYLDRLLVKQSFLLVFAITCHCMIIYDLTITSTWLSYFFYNFYDELIISVGLLQMGISYNGFMAAYTKLLSRTQSFNFWTVNYYNHLRKNLPARKKREIKT